MPPIVKASETVGNLLKASEKLFNGELIYINCDDETSRNFSFIQNAIQANLLAAKVNDRSTAIASEA